METRFANQALDAGLIPFGAASLLDICCGAAGARRLAFLHAGTNHEPTNTGSRLRGKGPAPPPSPMAIGSHSVATERAGTP